MDEVLLDRSQTFALAVQTGKLSAFAVGDFTDILIAQLTTSPFPKLAGTDWLDILKNGVREALMSEDPSIQTHLKQLADAYTLLAFLRQTPDVQGAVEKMFAHGKIWLDASVTLPLLVETLSEPSPGRFTRMINAAQEAGLNLFITPAIIEEIERHINRAQTCAQIGYRWEGSVPYLFERYIVSGRSVASFSNGLRIFEAASNHTKIFPTIYWPSLEFKHLAFPQNSLQHQLSFALRFRPFGTKRINVNVNVITNLLTK